MHNASQAIDEPQAPVELEDPPNQPAETNVGGGRPTMTPGFWWPALRVGLVVWGVSFVTSYIVGFLNVPSVLGHLLQNLPLGTPAAFLILVLAHVAGVIFIFLIAGYLEQRRTLRNGGRPLVESMAHALAWRVGAYVLAYALISKLHQDVRFMHAIGHILGRVEPIETVADQLVSLTHLILVRLIVDFTGVYCLLAYVFARIGLWGGKLLLGLTHCHSGVSP